MTSHEETAGRSFLTCFSPTRSSATFLCPSFSTSRALPSSFLVFVLLTPFVRFLARARCLLFPSSTPTSILLAHGRHLAPSLENRSSLSLSPAFLLTPISSRESFTCARPIYSLARSPRFQGPLAWTSLVCLVRPSVRVSRSVSFRRVAETRRLYTYVHCCFELRLFSPFDQRSTGPL